MPRTPPPRAALLASPDDTEAQFYEAMQAGDLERMMAVWADDDEVVCVHPGGARVIGLAAIRASFEAIFAQNAVPVQPEQVHRLHTQDSAVHHLAERVQVMTTEGPQSAWTLATNVYIKTALGWRMVAHHASPGQLGEAPPTLRETPSILH
ncbi:MAG: nuclear transport factor 2 family protein [Rubrivivax sp.]|nr:nuclear transport factor 2 family protein [Rubrivivax sp.]